MSPTRALAVDDGGTDDAGSTGLQCPFKRPTLPPFVNLGTPHLTYYGGRVITNAQIVQVNWGNTGTFEPHVTNGQMGQYYAGITNSRYLDGLSEYSTRFVRAFDSQRGTAQIIGRGTFGGAFTITPSTSATALTDAQVQAEIDQQITSNALPAPSTDAQGNVNTVYFVHFPHGVSIEEQGIVSCQQYCAYHSTLVHASKSVYYAVMPDMGPGSGCDTRCLTTFGPFDRATIVASHEMAEAITDAEIGLVTNPLPTNDAGVPNLRPAAWYDNNALDAFNFQGGEVADICQHWSVPTSIDDANGATWTVQREWSNATAECMASHLSNRSFELNNLVAWTATGTATVTVFGRIDNSGLSLGSASTATGDSSVTQKFDLPDPYGGGTLTMSVWYGQVCASPGSGSAMVTDVATGVTRALLPATCVNGGGWRQSPVLDLTDWHGRTVVVSLRNHDVSGSKHTTTMFDDVSATINPPSASNPVVNGSFEDFSEQPWTRVGTTKPASFNNSPVFTGIRSAMTGDYAPTAGDSSFSQTFTTQAGQTSLQFWVYTVCPVPGGSDGVSATLIDNTSATNSTPLPSTCTNTCSWNKVTASIVGGHNYTLTLKSHDDGVAGTATYAFWDDVSVQ